MPPTTIRLDPDVKDAVETLAEADGRSLSGYINRVLREHIASGGKSGWTKANKSKSRDPRQTS